MFILMSQVITMNMGTVFYFASAPPILYYCQKYSLAHQMCINMRLIGFKRFTSARGGLGMSPNTQGRS